MSYISCLKCTQCRTEYQASSVMNLCTSCNKPVEIVLDLTAIGNTAWYNPERSDMWRFGSLLPLDINNAVDRKSIITLNEGNTPLLEYSDYPLAASVGFELLVKEEGKAVAGFGSNPTQSFKDRGMSMAVSMARKLGIQRIVVPTQGNAGDSVTEYGLIGGLEVVVIMPENTPMPILGKVAAFEKSHPTIHLELVKGTIREAAKLMREKYLPAGWFSVATFQEPGWRIEGKKTMGLELAQPKKGGNGWSVPDVIVYPTGGGTGILGMWKAFDELEQLGKIDSKRPRMICVQSEATPPLVNAYESGALEPPPVDPGDTVATGLNVAGNVGHFKVLRIVRESRGCAVSVSDQVILQTLQEVYRKKGWWISPEGAACIAALTPLSNRGMIRKGDRVVVFNTCSMEKYFPSLRDLV
ncbi:MAG: threonine synthase [Bacteroidetes bacterium]|nr:threonine synthase [Bacteroidota bacterium]